MENQKPTTAQRAEILTQALPYIQKYYDKIVVVKYGGNAMINDDLKEAVMGDIVLLSLIGIMSCSCTAADLKLPKCSAKSARNRNSSTAYA